MKTLTRSCQYCNIQFEALAKEVKRGNGKFCSRSCSAKYSNENRSFITYNCVKCETQFKSKSRTAKYCSKSCRDLSQSSNIDYRYHTNKVVDDHVGTNECFNCGWNKAICDVAHIIPRSDGGSDEFSNLTVLCPNCHRLADNTNKLDITTLPTVSDRYRTISSSSSEKED